MVANKPIRVQMNTITGSSVHDVTVGLCYPTHRKQFHIIDHLRNFRVSRQRFHCSSFTKRPLSRLEPQLCVPCYVLSVSSLRAYLTVIDCAECVVTSWIESANSQVYGGAKIPAADSIPTCQDACAQNASCTGLDWDPNQVVGERCWIHGPWSERGVRTANGVTHYDIRRTDTCSGEWFAYCLNSVGSF